jgi:energy-converting hydrogenase A subunit P
MIPAPEVRANHCTRFRFRYSTCSRCVEACPHDALCIDDEGVTLDQDKCRRCGLCVGACRTETFTMPSLASMPLVEKARGRTSLSIACEPSGAAADVVVPCLGALGAAQVAYLLQEGTAVGLCGSGHCESCVHGTRGSGQLAALLEGVETLRAAGTARWAELTQIEGAPSAEEKPKADGMGRRRLFRRIANPSQAMRAPAAPVAAVPLRAIRPARPVASAQRDLLQLLKLDMAAEPVPALFALPAGDLLLQAGCTGCEACARACPTAALQVRETDVAWSLAFDASHCVGCGVCTESCQPRVLTLTDAVAAARLTQHATRVLAGRPKQRCQRCDRAFVSPEPAEMCDVCSGDAEDFDRIFG